MDEVIQFLFKGRFSKESYGFFLNTKTILINYFKILFLYIILVAIFAYFGFMESDKSSSLKSDGDIPMYFKLIFICLAGPIVEELVFRLPLEVSKVNIFVATFFLYLFLFFITKKYHPDINVLLKYSICFFILFVSWGLIYLKYDSISVILQKNFLIYFHLLTIAFCLVHYGNYNFNIKSVAPYLLMFLMLINGYYFAYTRLRFGFPYAIFIHIFHNTLISIPLIVKFLK
ncbi:hypothetical protein [Riemerella anatipestifer]|uniref:hypothetical protein n=1 Tax=Riemerella anatipestifer TaxID=34085 RepID=UPI00236473AA|nr:hypothetical protein [Riemerella anatipestifer]MDD1539445.1 CPBP family intramembrane metalloprotease [Riemerella anatipestifer]